MNVYRLTLATLPVAAANYKILRRLLINFFSEVVILLPPLGWLIAELLCDLQNCHAIYRIAFHFPFVIRTPLRRSKPSAKELDLRFVPAIDSNTFKYALEED